MKKIIIIIFAAFLASSCSNSFLDEAPKGQLTTDAFLSNEQNIDQWVNQIYGSINWRHFRLGYWWLIPHEMCADDYVPGEGGMASDLTLYAKFNHLPENMLYVDRMWERQYEYINSCNQVIDATKTFTDRTIAEKAEAQAKYFRAWDYFELVNTFGQCPLRDHVPTPDEYDLASSSVDDIYKQVISDLQFAIEHLPTRSAWGTNNLGRVTKGTAQGLLAKVYLFRQDYTNARKYANDVITGGEYSLDPSYRNIFSPDNTYSSENMMVGCYKYNASNTRLWNPFLEYQGVTGSFGNGFIYPSSDLVQSYEEGDPRKDATIFNDGDIITGFNNNQPVKFHAGYKYANKKIIWPYSYWKTGVFQMTEWNMTFMRYAEILLIYAEASNELGNTADAQAYLEKVRFRARGNKTFAQAGVLTDVYPTDKDALRKKIWDERRIELAMEGHRWYDLMRYIKTDKAYVENIIKVKMGRTNFTYPKHSVFPVPATKLATSNGILQQNPLWK